MIRNRKIVSNLLVDLFLGKTHGSPLSITYMAPTFKALDEARASFCHALSLYEPDPTNPTGDLIGVYGFRLSQGPFGPTLYDRITQKDYVWVQFIYCHISGCGMCHTNVLAIEDPEECKRNCRQAYEEAKMIPAPCNGIAPLILTFS